MSFKVIDGGGPDKEERERQEQERESQQELEWAQSEFSWALRDCAANVLRIVRGAGKPYELLIQMNNVLKAASKYRDAHDHYPSSDLIQTELALYDEYEQKEDRQSQEGISGESRNVLRDHAEVDRLWALHVIHRGALQVAESGLVGQDTQQRAGESELHRGMMMWGLWREERNRRREATRPSRAKAKNPADEEKGKRASSVPTETAAARPPAPGSQFARKRRPGRSERTPESDQGEWLKEDRRAYVKN